MFDWNAELEVAKRRVAELEHMVAQLKESLQPNADAAAQAPSSERNRETSQRILSIRLAALERARQHAGFVEHKVSTGPQVPDQLPYVELAEACFKVASWMPQGEAANTVRRNAATFYTRAAAQNEAMPSEAKAKEMFAHMAATWARPAAGAD